MNKTLKKVLIEFLIGIPVIIGLYALFEFLYCTFLTKSDFVFDASNLYFPILIWFIIELITFITRAKKSK